MNKEKHVAEEYLRIKRNKAFEKRVSEATEKALWQMDQLVNDEAKLRYFTHIFSRTLNEVATWLEKPKYLN